MSESLISQSFISKKKGGQKRDKSKERRMRKRKEEKPMRSVPKTKKMDDLEVSAKKKKRTFLKTTFLCPSETTFASPGPGS